MIHYLKGAIQELTPTHVILEQGGIGYKVEISLTTFNKLEGASEAFLQTHLHIKKEGQSIAGFDLYGFASLSEKDLFEKLISISGIGANTARVMLSAYVPEEIINAIASGNVAFIKSIKGIGQKTAERVILELRDKVSSSGEISEISSTSNNTLQNEALQALVMLGFTKSIARKAIMGAMKSNPEVSQVEELVKLAFRFV